MTKEPNRASKHRLKGRCLTLYKKAKKTIDFLSYIKKAYDTIDWMVQIIITNEALIASMQFAWECICTIFEYIMEWWL